MSKAEVIPIRRAKHRGALRLVTPSTHACEVEGERELLDAFNGMGDEQRRAFLSVAVTIAGRAKPVPPGQDGELIWHCDRLTEVQTAIDALYETISDDEERDRFMAPLDAEWFGIKDRLFKLAAPRTPAGGRAVALAAIRQSPRPLEDAVCNADLACWLGLTCAQYVLDVAPQPHTDKAS
jgi:hypothetical protein